MPHDEGGSARIHALRPVRLNQGQVRAANQIVQCLRDFPVHWGGCDWRLSVYPSWGTLAPGPGARSPDLPRWCVDLVWGRTPFRLLIDHAAPEAWVAATLPGLELPALPGPVAMAVIETALRAASGPLSQLGLGDIQVKGIESSATATHSPEESWTLQLSAGGVHLTCSMSTTGLGLAQLARCLDGLPRAIGPLGLHAFPVVLRAEVGFSRLALGEWAALRPGDAIVMDRPLLGTDGALWLAAGAWGLRARPEHGQWVVAEGWRKEGWAMDPLDDDDALDRLDGIRSLPLRVAFDIGEIRLSVGDLEGLQVGHVLDLGRPLSEAVSIRINGARVGHGELVDIDGRLGVVIRDLVDRDLEALPWSEVNAEARIPDLASAENHAPGADLLLEDAQAAAADIEIDLPPPEA